MKKLVKTTLAITLAASTLTRGVAAELPTPDKNSQKPNIVIIYSDDQGWGDVGYHGYDDIRTPNLDRLASEGVQFPQAYVSASVCGPSRAGMLTGVYQQRFGIYGNFKNSHIPQEQPMIMEMLKTKGYKTAVVGKWHMGTPTGLPNDRGADYFYGFRGGSHHYFNSDAEEGGKPGLAPIYRNNVAQPPIQKNNHYLTTLFTDEATSFIQRSADEPFFLYLAYNAVHYPWQAPPKYIQQTQDLPAGSERKHFAAMVLAMDEGVGSVVETLKENNLYDNTLIFFMSDNGSPAGQGFASPRQKKRGETTMSSPGPFNGFKGDTYEGGIRVPFIMRWAGKIPTDMKYPNMVSSLDIAPTIASVVGANTANATPFDGVNLMPYLNGEKPKSEAPHDTLYWRRDNDYAIRAGDWKLTWNDAHGPKTIRLFNMINDAEERIDLVNRYPEKAQALKNQFDAWEATLPINPHSQKPVNRNTKYLQGNRVDVLKFNQTVESR